MARKVFNIIVLIGGLVYIAYAGPRSLMWSEIKSHCLDVTKQWDVREGDMVFQHLPGKLLNVIADVTESPYSHCGIIVKKDGQFFVLEAIGPVQLTPLNKWVHRGVGSQVTVVRLNEEHQNQIKDIITEANKYLGRPYDIQYEWDDHKIYCSELLYKAVLNGAGIELAALKRLGELNWQPHTEFIKQITGGELPLNRKMITPVDLVRSDYVEIIYSNFPVQKSKI